MKFDFTIVIATLNISNAFRIYVIGLFTFILSYIAGIVICVMQPKLSNVKDIIVFQLCHWSCPREKIA